MPAAPAQIPPSPTWRFTPGAVTWTGFGAGEVGWVGPEGFDGSEGGEGFDGDRGPEGLSVTGVPFGSSGTWLPVEGPSPGPDDWPAVSDV